MVQCPNCGIFLDVPDGTSGDFQCQGCHHVFSIQAAGPPRELETKSYPMECPKCGAPLPGTSPGCHLCGFKFVERHLPVRKQFDLERVVRFGLAAGGILIVATFWFSQFPVRLGGLVFFGGLLLVGYSLSALPRGARGRIEFSLKGAFDPPGEEMTTLDLLLLALGVLMVVSALYV